MTLEEILEQWETDSQLPKNNLDEVSSQTPALHAKYLSLLVNAKLKLKKHPKRIRTLIKRVSILKIM